MTAAEVQIELAKLRGQSAPLVAQRDSYISVRETALAVDPRRFDPNTVSDLNRRIADMDELIASYTDRIALLEERLPTAEEVEAAQADARAACAQTTTATADFDAAWTALRAQTEIVVTAARVVAAAAAVAREARGRALAIRDDYALDLDVPDLPTPDRHEVAAVASGGRLVADVAYDRVIDPLVDRELAAAKAACDAVKATAG